MMSNFDIVAIVGEIYRMGGVVDVQVDDGDQRGLFFIDVFYDDYSGARIMDELEDIVVDYDGSVVDWNYEEVDKYGNSIGAKNLVTMLISDQPY